MDFSSSPKAQEWQARLDVFMCRYLLPHNAAWHQSVKEGIYPPPFLEDLKSLAKDEGLWNLFLPSLSGDQPGTAMSHLDYAPLAESMGRLPWAAEVFNCNAPDSGNMELLNQFASSAQKEQWLSPLLSGEIRSAFAMSEPDVASSDPTNIQTSVQIEGDDLVIHGRKWFITGAAHPQCQLLIVMCRNIPDRAQEIHYRHSMILVPLNTKGVHVVRNIPVIHHQSPEGHCEITFKQVRVPRSNLLGAWGEAFHMAQARLGPGRIHHCMRTIGQCELALQMALERALERKVFGKYLSEQSNIQDWIAESRLEIDQARLLVLKTAWMLDKGNFSSDELRSFISGIKVVAARLQTRVVDRAMQIFGAMGLSPDTPLAYFWTWGRALHVLDGPDEVHLKMVARYEFKKSKAQIGQSASYFTTPEQLVLQARISV
ncbi:MAG: acyl-CoA dehydrogenase family protein [Burkholderiales bacterium]|nr:acyl-CoA dehydrogenase family protein [Burkholderiales bacterium]